MGEVNAAIDVGKRQLEVALGSAGERFAENNEPRAIARLCQRLAAAGCARVLIEGGSYQNLLVGALRAAGLPVVIVNPRRVRQFARSTGQLAKTDALDARMLADLLRANLFPACFVMPPELEGLRRQLRFRRLVVEEAVRFKNKTAGLLMEAGIEYERRRLHGKRYFGEVMRQELIDRELRPLLEFSRSQTEELKRMDGRLMRMLAQHPHLAARVEALRKIDGVGPVTALSWALEVGDPSRFASIKRAVSYCGFASALRESAGQQKRGPLSKQRNRHLQTVLIEASKIGVMYHPKLREVHDQAAHKGHPNRATLAVARKLVAYLLAADRAFFAASAPA